MQAFLTIPRNVIAVDAPDAWFPGDLTTAAVYLALAMGANEKDALAPMPRLKIALKAGQIYISLGHFSRDTGVSIQTIRTCLSRLKKVGRITTFSTKHCGTVVTIVDYGILFAPKGDGQGNGA